MRLEVPRLGSQTEIARMKEAGRRAISDRNPISDDGGGRWPPPPPQSIFPFPKSSKLRSEQ